MFLSFFTPIRIYLTLFVVGVVLTLSVWVKALHNDLDNVKKENQFLDEQLQISKRIIETHKEAVEKWVVYTQQLQEKIQKSQKQQIKIIEKHTVVKEKIRTKKAEASDFDKIMCDIKNNTGNKPECSGLVK